MRAGLRGTMTVLVLLLSAATALEALAGDGEKDKGQKRAKAQQAENARKRKDAAAKRETTAKQKEAARKRQAEAEARREPLEKRKAEAQKGREQVVDKRQDFQQKRIDHGIKKGYLTEAEVAQLDAQQKKIAQIEESFKGDGKITKDEFRQLRNELDTASRCIWAQKHDAEGNPMAVYRLGTTVYARDNLTGPLQDETLSRAEAGKLLKDFRRTVELKRKLATDELTGEERVKLQQEFNELLNKYFEVRTPTA